MNDKMQDVPENEEGWKEKLTPEQYKILREGGTEVPFTGRFLHEKREGAYRCAACGSPLFSSHTKFDSGTGWPSFDEALPGAIEYEKDNSLGMARTEVRCANCHSHLGHIFDDLPADRQVARPNAEGRYCVNSVCLEFAPEGED
jgi:peptide-methionine (R)-S-oxide reductase